MFSNSVEEILTKELESHKKEIGWILKKIEEGIGYENSYISQIKDRLLLISQIEDAIKKVK